MKQFPQNFIWGAATSSYQIEGAWNKDGRGESIWDRFTHTAGNIKDQTNGDVACDHYHRWQDDIALMQSLNLQAYRFSIAWPRILPAGKGYVNQKGLDFYSRLVDELLEANITPYATLYHWDLPQVLHEQGGWAARDIVSAFVEYTDTITRHLGDRVTNWMTHNEPWVIAILGYQTGVFAPGIQDTQTALQVSHHLLLSHGEAIPVIRQNVPDAEVGMVLNFSPAYPASESSADYQATRRHEGWIHRWYLDPLYGLHYPADMVHMYKESGINFDFIQSGDMDTIATHTDFLGVNLYSRSIVRDNKAPDNLPITTVANEAHTDIGWEVYPDALARVLTILHTTYQIPKIFITENGASYATGPDENGEIIDTQRLSYFHQHLTVAQRAIQKGIPLAGYFAWSLMDNFEWADGYSQRFGLVWIDYETQERIPKASAKWYSKVIAQNQVLPIKI